jgi:transcriptional regulator with XRE-family HTH domain
MTEQADLQAPADVPPFVTTVAKNIRRAALDDDVSMTELAAAVGLGQPALSRRLNGSVAWTLGDLIAVARYFRVPLSRLAPDSLTNPTPPEG